MGEPRELRAAVHFAGQATLIFEQVVAMRLPPKRVDDGHTGRKGWNRAVRRPTTPCVLNDRCSAQEQREIVIYRGVVFVGVYWKASGKKLVRPLNIVGYDMHGHVEGYEFLEYFASAVEVEVVPRVRGLRVRVVVRASKVDDDIAG